MQRLEAQEEQVAESGDYGHEGGYDLGNIIDDTVVNGRAIVVVPNVSERQKVATQLGQEDDNRHRGFDLAEVGDLTSRGVMETIVEKDVEGVDDTIVGDVGMGHELPDRASDGGRDSWPRGGVHGRRRQC